MIDKAIMLVDRAVIAIAESHLQNISVGSGKYDIRVHTIQHDISVLNQYIYSLR